MSKITQSKFARIFSEEVKDVVYGIENGKLVPKKMNMKKNITPKDPLPRLEYAINREGDKEGTILVSHGQIINEDKHMKRKLRRNK